MLKKSDPEAEAVMRKALEEEREENGQLRMRLNDSAGIAAIAPREPEDKLDPAPRELDVRTPSQKSEKKKGKRMTHR